MTETAYQNKIMKWVEEIGGVVVNGQYSKRGEADLQVGFPYEGTLLHLAIEVNLK